jgi:hypothetical protein
LQCPINKLPAIERVSHGLNLDLQPVFSGILVAQGTLIAEVPSNQLISRELTSVTQHREFPPRFEGASRQAGVFQGTSQEIRAHQQTVLSTPYRGLVEALRRTADG